MIGNPQNSIGNHEGPYTKRKGQLTKASWLKKRNTQTTASTGTNLPTLPTDTRSFSEPTDESNENMVEQVISLDLRPFQQKRQKQHRPRQN